METHAEEVIDTLSFLLPKAMAAIPPRGILQSYPTTMRCETPRHRERRLLVHPTHGMRVV
jgi:hypothetical protein